MYFQIKSLWGRLGIVFLVASIGIFLYGIASGSSYRVWLSLLFLLFSAYSFLKK